jgi:hypothetical protein
MAATEKTMREEHFISVDVLESILRL